MSQTFVFTIRQSTDESRPYGVRFRKREVEEPDFVIASVDIKAYDAAGTDVTSTVLVAAATGYEANVAMFRTKSGLTAGTYVIRAKATMTDGSAPSAWGLVVAANPAI